MSLLWARELLADLLRRRQKDHLRFSEEMMAQEHSLDGRIQLVKNTFYSGLTTSAGLLLFAVMVLSGRHLGSTDFGIFSFALALASVFAIATDFGLEDLVVREVARDRERAEEYFGNVLVWKSILSVVVVCALVLTVNILKSSMTIRVVTYLLGAMAILRSFQSTVRAFFRAFERFDLESMVVVADRAVLFGAAAFFILTGHGVVALAWAFVGVRCLSILAALMIFHRRVARIVPKFDVRFIQGFQIQALPFGLAFMCFGLYSYFDKILLSVARSDAEVGLYNASFQIFEGLMVLPTIIGAVVYPRLSQLFVTDSWRHRDLFSRSMKYMMIIAFPIAAWGVLFSGDIIALLFGDGFLDSALPLALLFCGVVFAFQNILWHILLNSMDKQRYMLATTVAGLAVALLLDLLLIPRYGIVGAATGTIGYAVTIFCSSYLYVYFRYARISIWRIGWRPLLCVLIIGVLVWLLRPVSMVLSLALFIPLYVLLLFCVRVFDRFEIELVQKFFSRHLLGR